MGGENITNKVNYKKKFEKKNFRKKKFEKFFLDFFSLCHPPATPECPQKISAPSVQPLGRLYGTYI